MARINVEDSLFKDIRFYELLQKLGGLDAALGSLVRAWTVAQVYWPINGIGIPLTVWKTQKLRPELLEVGLAEIQGDFVYVAGSKQQFSWMHVRSEAGKRGGKKSGEARRAIIEEKMKQTFKIEAPASKSKPLTLPLTLTLEEKNIYISNSQETEECIQAWGYTLERFQIRKNPKSDEVTITRLIKIHGFENTKLALIGAGLETKTDRYDPAKYCRITRLLKPDIFELCVNLGSQKVHQKEWKTIDAI